MTDNPLVIRLPRRRLAVARRLGVAVVFLAVLVAGLRWSRAAPESLPVREPQRLSVPVGAESDATPVRLDADLYLPDGDAPAPAVLLAHGFGGSNRDLRAEASRLASAGYVVLAYSARGFGESGGRIHLLDPAFEVADVGRLIDVLGRHARVARDGAGDPRVGVVGASYGGAVALLGAAADHRVDAVVAMYTWHDLADAFFPQSALRPGGDPLGPSRPVPSPGPYKQLWGATFLGAAATGGSGAGAGGGCGRFEPRLCRALIRAAETGRPTAALLDALRAHSPARTLARLRAPTFLVQGMSDTLFGLEHADATARALLAGGTPVAVRWTNAGHDTPGADDAVARTEQTQVAGDVDAWLARTLRGETRSAPAGFTYTVRARRGQDLAPTFTLPSYADLLAPSSARTVARLPVRDRGPATLVNPPGGVPSAVTALPTGLGLGATSATYRLAALPGQHLAFDTAPVTGPGVVAGAPRVRLTVTSSGEQVTLFASLWQVQGGTARLLRQLVAPARIAVTPGEETPVELALPAATWELPVGASWRVLLTTTDAAYRGDPATRVDRIRLAEPVLTVPLVHGSPGAGPRLLDRETRFAGGLTGLLLLGLAGLAVARRARRRRRPPAPGDDADAVLVVDGLGKTFGDGHRAVDAVGWTARRGQVVGLLGPNGAGKTTTLRMAVGLIRPDAGEARILGEPVAPGAAVLARVGALIEGPGFVPHLSGRENLRAYWAATGRPEGEAGLAAALDVAALGGALERPVKSYSHGMRQRLGIAQAMLGRPDLLILDEPANGLDPPQIAALRPILQRYAASGRTVVVSSHLLAEVQLTCSHVVVMHVGRVLAAGAVGDLGVGDGRSLEEVFLETIAGVDRQAPAEDAAARTERLRQVRPR